MFLFPRSSGPAADPSAADEWSSQVYDVVVIGGGNAGLCAAITAREAGASVILLESAPREFRGGNSRHTRNLRCIHEAPTEFLTDSYTEEEFLSDLVGASGDTDERLARMTIRASAGCPEWMRRFGVRFQSPLRGTLHLARTNAFFLGGGKALVNSYHAAAERLGIRVIYGAEVVDLDIGDETFRSATALACGRQYVVRARAAVLAAGGFQSNLEWLGEAWGDASDNFIIRGTPYNRGRLLRLMFAAGAEPVGDPRECHAVAVDARAPKFDGGIVTRLDCVSLGIVVNTLGDRFYDEGEDFWPKRYAIWGKLVAAQPHQLAFSIVDSKAIGRFMPSMYPPHTAHTIGEMAAKLNLSADRLQRTVDEFNSAVRCGTFNHAVLDDCRTEGLRPDKTHWAQRLDSPPFLAYPLRPGITFTYLGVTVDDRARVLTRGGHPFRNIYSAGEMMAGNILKKGYVAGVGMTIGTVFGRIAGEEASGHAAR